MDFISWERQLTGFDETFYSPPINGRLLRVRAAASGVGFSEGFLRLTDSWNKVICELEGVTEIDSYIRVPVESPLLSSVQFADGYPVVEAPAIWGALKVYATGDVEGTLWRFWAIVER